MKIDIAPFQARLERVGYDNHLQIVNFADITNLTKPKSLNDFTKAVVFGQGFSELILSNYDNEIFYYHIDLIKTHLSQAAYKVFHYLTIEGYSALILPPLFLKNDNPLIDFNKEIAKKAGVGHTGKKGFFISPTYGVKVLIISILTNAPLEVDPEFKMDMCKNCPVCDNSTFEEAILKCPYGKDKNYEKPSIPRIR